MFQFTTTNVINSLKDYTSGKDLLVKGTDALNILRVGNFKKENVTAIYKAVANDPEMAKATINLANLSGQNGDVFRLNLYIGLTQGSADSRYANDLAYKGKSFSVDFIWKTDEKVTAELLEKNIKKYDLMVYGEKLLDVSHNEGCITIEATSEYQKFIKINVEKFDETAHFGMGEYTPVITLEDLGEAKKSNAEVLPTEQGYFPGKEGFGTYSYLLHNLRIPTSARTNAFAPNQDEAPIIGAKYNQYTIHYCADRGPLGLNAVGDTVKSVTTHVFYVKDDLDNDFSSAITATLGTPVEVPKVRPTSTSGSTDETGD